MVKAWCSIGFLIILSWMSVSMKAEGDVLSLNTSALQEMALERIPPWPDEMVLSGTNQHWQKVLHEGEFVVALYEAMPAVIDISEPYPYDEYVRVLEGSVVLTSSLGERQSYEAGDAFLVPVGWTGTWEMPTRFRELIIIDRKGWDAVESMIATLFGVDAESSTDQTTVLPLLTASLKKAPLEDLPPWPTGGGAVRSQRAWPKSAALWQCRGSALRCKGGSALRQRAVSLRRIRTGLGRGGHSDLRYGELKNVWHG